MTNLQDKKIDKSNIFKKEDWSSAYQNVKKELTKEPLKISKGNNIKNLNGTLLRNGPGILERGGQWVHHAIQVFSRHEKVTALGLYQRRIANRIEVAPAGHYSLG